MLCGLESGGSLCCLLICSVDDSWPPNADSYLPDYLYFRASISDKGGFDGLHLLHLSVLGRFFVDVYWYDITLRPCICLESNETSGFQFHGH